MKNVWNTEKPVHVFYFNKTGPRLDPRELLRYLEHTGWMF